MKFTVNRAKYQNILANATKEGLTAVSEQFATDTDEFIKWDSGDLKASRQVSFNAQGQAEVSWNTPYAVRQYYTGTPINHGHGNTPHLMWAHKTWDRYKNEYLHIIKKAFGGDNE